MSLHQVDALQLGPFSPGSYSQVAQVFSSITPPAAWSSVTAYVANQCVEYSGGVWRATQAGTNQTPGPTSAYWELILPTVKDGDVCLVVNGASSDINIRTSGTWRSVLNVPITVTLPNNTTGTVAMFPLSTSRAGTIQYSIVNNGSYQNGTIRYESDGTNAILSDSGNLVLDGSPGITFDVSVVGSNVVLSYTSTNLSVSPATMSYTIQGWQ
jgi:hypothetical protein